MSIILSQPCITHQVNQKKKITKSTSSFDISPPPHPPRFFSYGSSRRKFYDFHHAAQEHYKHCLFFCFFLRHFSPPCSIFENFQSFMISPSQFTVFYVIKMSKRDVTYNFVAVEDTELIQCDYREGTMFVCVCVKNKQKQINKEHMVFQSRLYIKNFVN